MGSPDETLMNAILSPEKSTTQKVPAVENSDRNNNTPKVSPVKSTEKKIAGDPTLMATPNNAI